MTASRDEKRIKQVLDYIDDNIASKLTLALLADRVHLSEFHFHRLFKKATNQTLNQYIRRKRLTKALYCVQYFPTLSLSSIATRCGFSSAANFSKAFNQYYGCSPSQLRSGDLANIDKNSRLFSEVGVQLGEHNLYQPKGIDASITEHFDITYSIIKRPEEHYIYVPSKAGYEIDGINSAWMELRQLIHTAGITEGEKVGLCHDNYYLTTLDQCRYEAAVRVTSLQGMNDFNQRTLPPMQYLRVHIKGPTDKLNLLYLYLLAVELPRRKLLPAHHLILENYQFLDEQNNFMDVMTEFPIA